ncbi:hypothetical protein, partial [Pseudomonas syringae group genomosp. 7]|uniref:hypothetical protein n=1 Tax=Pseudomonas syringae group genomosp. 7 TaxID=251699 RepID=UPI00376FB21B
FGGVVVGVVVLVLFWLVGWLWVVFMGVGVLFLLLIVVLDLLAIRCAWGLCVWFLLCFFWFWGGCWACCLGWGLGVLCWFCWCWFLCLLFWCCLFWLLCC